MSTKELLRFVHGREIRYEMVDGIAHLPTDALEEYRGPSLLTPCPVRRKHDSRISRSTDRRHR